MAKKPPKIETLKESTEMNTRFKELINSLQEENKKLKILMQDVFNEFDVCSKQENPAQIIFHFGIARERLRMKYSLIIDNKIKFY